MNTKKAQRGMTIVELTIAIATAGILAAAASRGMEYAVRSNSATNLATQGVTNYDALQDYVATNVDALITGAAIPGVAVPLAPTQAEMQALGYRTFSTTSTAGNGIVWNYSITRTPAACTPQTCNFLVYAGLSGSPRAKDNSVDIPLVADAAQKSGRAAGFSTLASPTVISGLGGAWTLPNPVGNASGILSFYGSYGAGQFNNYVRLGDTRPVTLNNTLAVAGNLSSAANISATGAVGAGTTLTSGGNATIGGNASMAGSVTAGANINASGNANITGTANAANSRSSIWATSVGVAHTMRDNGGTAMHTDVVPNGRYRWVNSAWTAEIGSLDQGGNLWHPGTATNAGMTSSGQINANNGRVKIAAAAWSGWGCWEGNGTITTDPNGLILSCQSGVWRRTGSGTTTHIGWGVGIGPGGLVDFDPRWWVSGTTTITGTVMNYGGGNCEGSTHFALRDVNGSYITGWIKMSAMNEGNGNDGGSGMWKRSTFSIPMTPTAQFVQFYSTGCHTSVVYVNFLTT